MKAYPERAAAMELLKKYNSEPFHIQHAWTVEGTMRWYANELGYGEDADFCLFRRLDGIFLAAAAAGCEDDSTRQKRYCEQACHQGAQRFLHAASFRLLSCITGKYSRFLCLLLLGYF